MHRSSRTPNGQSSGRSSRHSRSGSRGGGGGSTWVFYIVQGCAGESSTHPNVFRVRKPVGEMKLADVINAFPLTQETGSRFHFRFKVPAGGSISTTPTRGGSGVNGEDYCYMDLVNPDDNVPTCDGHVQIKALQLDTLRCVSQRTNRFLKRRQPPSNGHAAPPSVPDRTKKHVRAASLTGLPRRSPTNVPRGSDSSRTGQTQSPTTPQHSADAAAATSDVAGAGGGGGAPQLPPGLVPVPEHVVVDEEVEMPEHIDDDLKNSGKSDYVIARIQRRRDEARAKHAARLQALRDAEAAAKEASELRHKAQHALGAKIDSWRLDSNGQLNNIRVLLCTLQNVLWEDAKWKPVKMSELINDRKVHIKYLRACTVVHPDKNMKVGHERAYIAERVFEALNEAKNGAPAAVPAL